MATQQNLNTFIEMLSDSESFAMPDVLQNLETAQTLLDETLGTDYMLYGAFEPEPIMELSFMTASYEPSMEDECDTLTLEAIMTLDGDLCPLPECATETTEPSLTTQPLYSPEVCYDPTVLVAVTQDDLQHVV